MRGLDHGALSSADGTWRRGEEREGDKPKRLMDVWLGLPLIASEGPQEVIMMGKSGPV